LPKDALNLSSAVRETVSVYPLVLTLGSWPPCLLLASKNMRTILLAEDDDSMRRFLAKALERAGYDVVSYGNGAEAFEGLKEKPVTLLLTDIVMPEMDGIELAKRACELHPDMKIMFITGFAAVALQHYSEAPKQSRILSKPVHLKDLVREVDRMLAA
jgi:two-component system, cell cycle response regulator CpdR